MELDFQQTQVDYLQCVLWERICQEETGEAIVPDSYPDIEQILNCFGTVVMRSKECRDGEAVMSCGIQACVLYRAEGEALPRCVDLYLPFNVSKRSEGLKANSDILFRCQIRSIDARMLGSRKLLVRVNVLSLIEAFDKAQILCFASDTQQRGVQMKCAAYPMLLPAACGEKTFSMQDRLPLETGQPGIARLLRATANCDVTESKMLGSRAVFKGEFRLQILYESDAGALCSAILSMPFSHFIDFGVEYDEEPLELVPMFHDLQVSSGSDAALEVELSVCVQCCVMQSVTIPMIEDAYATNGVLSAQWQTCRLQPCLDSRTLRQTVRQMLPGEAGSILNADLMLDVPEYTHHDGQGEILIPATASVLYQDREGICQHVSQHLQIQMQADAADCLCHIMPMIEGDVFAAPAGNGMELRCNVNAQCDWYEDRDYSCICACDWEPQTEPEERPAVIIRTLEQDSSIWNLAKELRTTVSAIQIANDVTDEELRAGSMVLIPIIS